MYDSGLATDQLRGQRVALGKLVAYWQASTSIIGDLYLGGSIESGNAWKKDEAMVVDDLMLAGSVFVGFDSVLGPLYLAYGQADEGMSALYFYLGRTFRSRYEILCFAITISLRLLIPFGLLRWSCYVLTTI